MKKVLSIFTFFTIFSAFAFVGCKSDKQKASNATGFELAMTDKDTTAIVNLVNNFFQAVESGEITDAVAMLYQDNNNDPYQEPTLLDNDQIQRMTSMLKALPIIEHHIDYVKFNEAYSNEVKVTAIIAKAEGNMPEVKTVFYFKPYDFQGNWRLCVVDSEKGDERIIDNNQADSVSKKFEKEMHDKSN